MNYLQIHFDNSSKIVVFFRESENQAVSQSQNSSDTWMGYLGNVVSSVPNYLPSQVTDTLLQERAFATVHHNLSGKKNICALAM